MNPVKRLQVNKKEPTKKLVAIRADQVVNQNVSTFTSRGPNILKRTHNESKNTGKIYLNATQIPNLKIATSTPIKVIHNLRLSNFHYLVK